VPIWAVVGGGRWDCSAFECLTTEAVLMSESSDDRPYLAEPNQRMIRG
jgi:hypothetical protein